jgi:nucleotide-binding universal stress UspA family protein
MHCHKVEVMKTIFVPASGTQTDAPVFATALAVAKPLAAHLVVVGGYGHRPLREAVFGVVTRALIERAVLPVLMMH